MPEPQLDAASTPPRPDERPRTRRKRDHAGVTSQDARAPQGPSRKTSRKRQAARRSDDGGRSADAFFAQAVQSLFEQQDVPGVTACGRALASVLERDAANEQARDAAVYTIVIDGYFGGDLAEYDRNDPTKPRSLRKLLDDECLVGVPGLSRVSEMIAAVRADRKLAAGGTVRARERFTTRVLATLWGKHRNDKARLRSRAKQVAGLPEKEALSVLRAAAPGGKTSPPTVATLVTECKRLRALCRALLPSTPRVLARPQDLSPASIERGLADIETLRGVLDVAEQELREVARCKKEGN